MSKPRYISAAFRSSNKNEAYLFMKDEYVLVNYAPGSKNDRIVYGPLRIRDGFPSLANTRFATNGIDCAFDSELSDETREELEREWRHEYYPYGVAFSVVIDPYSGGPASTNAYKIANNEAYIFSGNLCAHINYAPHSNDDKIIIGPMHITSMFPFFKGTMFENGIDAAFRSSKKKEAYLFKGAFYARINYESKQLIQNIQLISKGFPSLAGTIFESGVDAAFASHRKDEAYLFKGEYYVLIDFAPGTTNDYLIGGGVKRILEHWPSLRGIIPRYN